MNALELYKASFDALQKARMSRKEHFEAEAQRHINEANLMKSAMEECEEGSTAHTVLKGLVQSKAGAAERCIACAKAERDEMGKAVLGDLSKAETGMDFDLIEPIRVSGVAPDAPSNTRMVLRAGQTDYSATNAASKTHPNGPFDFRKMFSVEEE